MPDPIIARCIDLETTGLPEDEGAEIIEIGRIDVHIPTRRIGRPWSTLVRPRGPIPAVTKAVHHITEKDVEGAPSLREVWDRIFSDIGPADVLVAHNDKMEKHFLGDVGHQFICTYKCARVVWPDAPGHSNQVLRYWLGIELDADQASPPHRALPDAYVTAHILARLLETKTIAEMVNISKFPALLTVMNFGKHRGTRFEDAPADYLEWIRDKSEMDEDTKFSARYWLRKRMSE